MSRVSSTAVTASTGLVSGIPIEETVNQLIAISARPRDTLVARTEAIQNEQAAVDQLSALVLSVQLATDQFSQASTFTGRTANSTSDAVSVAIPSGSTPSAGSYQITPLQTASAHQLVSGVFADPTDPFADGGTLRLGFGGHVDQSVDLADLNGGAGVAAGQIKITDKNGDSTVVDLRAAQTVGDVVRAINESFDINVSATADGDRLVLTDESGGGGTLSVRDVGLGTTATDLGLTFSTAGGSETVLTGQDVFGLTSTSRLETLNDGLGVRIATDEGEADLVFTLQDGAEDVGVDLTGATTLGDVVDAINSSEELQGRVTASISTDGRRLVLADNTTGSGSFTVTNGEDGSAATDLGLTAAAVGGEINGERLVAGLQDTLVSSLNGGAGIELGTISITDRSGASVTNLDLSTAETLGEIISTINGSGLGVEARINSARSGIELVDTTGATASNLIVADTDDGTVTATALGLVSDGVSTSVDSGSLRRQSVSGATLLSSLNGGAGVELGDFRITDSTGATSAVDLNTAGSEASTLGDVIDRINDLSIGVEATLNATGDGILLTDTAGGAGTLTVAEVSGGTTAADLNLVGASTATDEQGRQTIDGSSRFEIDLSDLEGSTDGVTLASLGVDAGDIFRITVGNQSAAINLGDPGDEAFTVGDVIDKINASGLAIAATTNEAGTGIELSSTSGETITVSDLGSGRAAAQLNLAGESSANNEGVQTIDSGFLFSAADADAGALNQLVDRINDLGAGVTASILNDLNGPRLVLTADTLGAANELLIETDAAGFSFTETSRPTDAAALFGPAGAGGVVVRSQTNRFDGLVDGLDVTINEATDQTATINVTSDDAPLVDAAQGFVTAYNSLRSTLASFTSFDEETLTTGILFGRNEAIRVDTDLSRILSGRAVFGIEYGSLESVGIELQDDGTLALDSAKLTEAFADDPNAVEQLFTDEQNGIVARLTTAIDQLADEENSLLTNRSEALGRTIDSNNERVSTLTESLERERERLLLEFIQLEETIALLQSNTSAIDSIQPITFASANGN